MKNNQLLSIEDLNKSEIINLFKTADKLRAKIQTGYQPNSMKGKILANIFFQPSTRTHFGFESAMIKLGGQCIDVSNINATRSGDYYKESLNDMLNVLNKYVDIIVLRHYDNASIETIKKNSDLKIINAGIGNHEHPIQALNFLYCLYRENVLNTETTIGLLGDPDIRSLRATIKGLNLFGIKKMHLLLPENHIIPNDIINFFAQHHITYKETKNIDELVKNSDALLTIGVNHPNHKTNINGDLTWSKSSEKYIITPQVVFNNNPSILIYHPLPRTDEIDYSVDKLHNAKYFEACENNLYLNMAILELIGA